MSRRVRRLLPLLALVAAAPLGAQAPAYHLAKKIPVPGDAGWDYLTLDAERHRLFVAHGTKIDVVDLAAGKTLGAVESLTGAHGAVAVGETIYATSGKTDEVVAADGTTFAVRTRIKVTGAKPDAIMLEPVTGRLFTFNGDGKNATAIDPATNTVVGTVALGGGPEFPAADGTGKVFVNIEDTSELVEFDAKSLKVLRRWKLAACDGPTGLALDATRARLFSVCANKVMAVSDVKTGKVLQTLPIGARVDAAAVDPASGIAFASNGDGTMTMVAPKDGAYEVLGTLETPKLARTMAYDPKTKTIYVASAEFGPTPAATEKDPRPRPPVVPGTFAVFVFEPTR